MDKATHSKSDVHSHDGMEPFDNEVQSPVRPSLAEILRGKQIGDMQEIVIGDTDKDLDFARQAEVDENEKEGSQEGSQEGRALDTRAFDNAVTSMAVEYEWTCCRCSFESKANLQHQTLVFVLLTGNSKRVRPLPLLLLLSLQTRCFFASRDGTFAT